ncbi:MAG: hypothetical protein FRX49_12038 [Trebouxia sp. A1-2]|nr:MAG: hypothetical protein FRX49_12038 [Trebouxia sp. A1-2]
MAYSSASEVSEASDAAEGNAIMGLPAGPDVTSPAAAAAREWWCFLVALDVRLLLSLEPEDCNSAAGWSSFAPASLMAATPPLTAFLSAEWSLLGQSLRGLAPLNLAGLLPLDWSCSGVEPDFGPATTWGLAGEACAAEGAPFPPLSMHFAEGDGKAGKAWSAPTGDGLGGGMLAAMLLACLLGTTAPACTKIQGRQSTSAVTKVVDVTPFRPCLHPQLGQIDAFDTEEDGSAGVAFPLPTTLFAEGDGKAGTAFPAPPGASLKVDTLELNSPHLSVLIKLAIPEGINLVSKPVTLSCDSLKALL